MAPTCYHRHGADALRRLSAHAAARPGVGQESVAFQGAIGPFGFTLVRLRRWASRTAMTRNQQFRERHNSGANQ